MSEPKGKKAISFADALAAIESSSPLTEKQLRVFNTVDDRHLAEFFGVWDKLDAERRAYVAEKLQMLVADDFEVDFSPIFQHALDDADARVRLSSIEGLEYDESLELIDKLIALMRHDPVEDVRAAAAESLGRFMLLGEMNKLSQRRRAQVYSALMAVLLTTSEDSAEYARALESVAYVSNDEVDYFVRAAYKSEDDDLRVSAVAAMGRSADPVYEDIVRNELNSESADMRAEAAAAAGELELVESVAQLGKMLDDPMPFVAIAAIDALAAIGTREAQGHLERASESDDDEVAEAAEEALEELQFMNQTGIDMLGSGPN
jgi:HEAT repeat protein